MFKIIIIMILEKIKIILGVWLFMIIIFIFVINNQVNEEIVLDFMIDKYF